MKSFVVDASVAIKWFVLEEHSAELASVGPVSRSYQTANAPVSSLAQAPLR